MTVTVPYLGPVISQEDARASGLRRYFTGEPCARGHLAQRAVAGTACLVCKAERGKKWRAENPGYLAAYADASRERLEAYRAKRYAANKESAKAEARAWRLANPERKAAIDAAWRAANPEKTAANKAAWQAANPDRKAAAQVRWRKNNPEASRAIVRNRRARLRNSEGQHTKEDVLALFARQKAKCACCRISIKAGYDVDHIMPIALGGSNAPSNLQLLCAPCNRSKNAKDPIVWANARGLLL
jgi:5-methylcytosine-specific restriction endonuclease McrA